ncbi:reverse transcriptase domain-containing protein [Roseibium aggregatum]|uniref:reverse transcriptase domain-containing protein n=1 Tax=Roseibium aggregatum TaxID=187304 RepID=UPI003A96DF16
MPRQNRADYVPLSEEEIAAVYPGPIKPIARPFFRLDAQGNLDPSRRIMSDTEISRRKHHNLQKKIRRLARLASEGKLNKAKRLAYRVATSSTCREISARKALKKAKPVNGEAIPSASQLATRIAHSKQLPPGVVKVFAEPKDDGRLRLTYDYPLVDRAAQQLVARSFGSLVQFHPTQGGVPGTSRKTVVDKARALIKTGQYKYGLETDITNFFPSIRWEQLARYYGIPTWVFEDIASNHRKETYTHGNKHAKRNWDRIRYRHHRHGLPQGAATSPLFAYGLLKEVFEQFENERLEGIAIVNYCDNILILGETRENVEHAFQTLARLLRACPVAEMSLRRTTSIRPLGYGIKFIGYRFAKRRGMPIVRMNEDLRRKLRVALIQHKRAVNRERNTGLNLYWLCRKCVGYLQEFLNTPEDAFSEMHALLRDRFLISRRTNIDVLTLLKFIAKNLPTQRDADYNSYGEPKNALIYRGTKSLSRTGRNFDGVPASFKIRDAVRRLDATTAEQKLKTATFVEEVVRNFRSRP